MDENAHHSRLRDLIPAKIPDIRDATLSAVYYGQRRGGDFYDFFRSSGQRIWLGLFDVAGRIEGTRPVTLAVQEKFRSCAIERLAGRSENDADAVLDLWFELNQAVMGSAGGVHSCSAFIACYNEDCKSLCYVNAGHTAGLVRQQQDIRELRATAVPLGLFSHSSPEHSALLLAPSDRMLLVSRGVVEAQHRGEEYGIERAKQYLLESGTVHAHELCVGVLSRVRQFMQTTPTHNDVTALALVRACSDSSLNRGQKSAFPVNSV